MNPGTDTAPGDQPGGKTAESHETKPDGTKVDQTSTTTPGQPEKTETKTKITLPPQ